MSRPSHVFSRAPVACLLLLTACAAGSVGSDREAGARDAAATDAAATDGGQSDGGASIDAGAIDGGRSDGGAFDAGTMDAATADAGRDAGGADAGLDAGAAMDAGRDAGLDAGVAMDAGRDAGIDAGADAGRDAGVDAGRDAGRDAGIDAGATTGCGSPLRIGLYATDLLSNHVIVKSYLDATGRFASVTIGGPIMTTPPATPPPSLAELNAFDAVLVWGSGSWDGTAFGDVLANYVDEGHGVVIAVFAQRPGASTGIAGRMLTAGYLPYVPASHGFAALSIGAVALPAHPIMAGVTTFSGTNIAYHDGTTSAGATLVASWNNGRPLVATIQPSAGRVVLFGNYPPMFWDTTTDGARLTANMLHWSACGD